MSPAPAALGDFFEPGRAYTTHADYVAPEEAFEFACAAVTRTPFPDAIDEDRIAFGFLRTSSVPWTPTGLLPTHFARFRGHTWHPTTAPEWLTAAVAAATVLSPLAQAEDAKRARDLAGEIGALMAGGTALESAPWYPARPGDLVHVHYEAGGVTAAFGETYRITAGAHGFLSMRLLCHTLPDGEPAEGVVGCFAVDDDPDPLMELWMEAGPQRLTIVRDGRVVHAGQVAQ
ncbi:hypothetical protein ACWD4Z_23005 [Streptomyces antibioticus]